MKPNEIDSIKQQNKEKIPTSNSHDYGGNGYLRHRQRSRKCFCRISKTNRQQKYTLHPKTNRMFRLLCPRTCGHTLSTSKAIIGIQPNRGKGCRTNSRRIGKEKIYTRKVLCRIDAWDFLTSEIAYGKGYENIPLWNEIPFLKDKRRSFYVTPD